MQKLIFLDTETTGLDPKIDEIIQIACVKVDDLEFFEINQEQIFHSYVKPSVGINMHSFRIHGISEEFLKDKPTFDQISTNLVNFISSNVIVAHNASFDMGFLNRALSKAGLQSLDNKVIDSLVVARRMFKGQAVGLDRLPKLLGIPFNRNLHSALEDAIILAKVYAAMMKPKTQSLFIKEEKISTENHQYQKYQMCHYLIDVGLDFGLNST